MNHTDVDIQESAPHDALMPLLLEADPSEARIKEYLPSSSCFVAKEGESTVGICVLAAIEVSVLELMNIAVKPARRRNGIGMALLKHAINVANRSGVTRLEVGTGAFGYQLAFYQRAGFRPYRILKDFFLENYDKPIFEAGLQHKDMIRLLIEFEPGLGDNECARRG